MALIRCPNCDTLHDLDGAMFATGPRKVRCASCREVWLASDGQPVRPPPTPAEIQLPPAPPPLPPEAPAEAAQPDFDRIDAGAPPPVPMEIAPAPALAAIPEPPAAVLQNEAAPAAPPKAAGPDPEDEAARRSEERRKNRAAGAAPTGRAAAAKRQPAAFAVVLAAASFGTLATLTFMRHETVRVLPHTAAIFEAVGLPVSRHAFDIADVRSRLVREDSRDTLEVVATLVNLTRDRQRIPVLRLALHDASGQDIYVWTATADVPELGPGERTTVRRRLANPPAEAQSVLVRFLAKDDIVAAIR